MTKKDLKNGMIVELREGTRYLYCEGVMRGLNAWDLISTYTDDLKCPEFSRLDIVKVYEDTKEYNLNTIFEHDYLKLIWQRPKPPKLSEREIEILKALDVLGYKYIARDKGGGICVYSEKPYGGDDAWVWSGFYGPFYLSKELFSFITFEDKGYTTIKDILSDFEKENKDFDR